MLAYGLCATCYTLKGQEQQHFGGLREAVLERDAIVAACTTPRAGISA